MAELKLDFKDRLILVNQYRILEKVDPDNAASHQRAIKILEEGYEFEYDSLDGLLDHDVVGVAVCKEVYEILEMYRRLHDGYAQLADKSGIDASRVPFPGFDGNNEGVYLSYGEFLNSQNKYDESPVRNSHMPTLAGYRRMLSEFNKVRSKIPLDKADIQRILDARLHRD